MQPRQQTVRIPRWAQGRPGFGQGGWSSAQFAAVIGEPVTIDLRSGVPLEEDLAVLELDGGWELRHGDTVIMAARPRDVEFATVQPVSIAFTRLDGMPIGRNLRPYYAWYGDMDMASHMWGVAALGTVTVVVEFHPTATLAAFGSRKALALHCRNLVAGGLSAALSGRRQFAANPQVAAPGT